VGRYAKPILDIVTGSGEHLTAEEIHRRLRRRAPGVVLATVYNNLHELEERGLVRRLSLPEGPDRYDGAARHDHLLCCRCGALEDVVLEDLAPWLRERLGTAVLGYELQVKWLCPACRAEERDEGGAKDGNIQM
jgi:Fe2+ or Zn2+ uptake regulation protein